LWLALRSVEPAAIVSALQGIDWLFGLPFLVFYALFCIVKAVRWSLLLRGVSPVRGSILLEPVLLGYAATTFLPLQLGELVRGTIAARRLGVPTTAVLVSIGIERLLDLLALLALFGLSVLIAPKASVFLRGAAVVVAIISLLSVACLVVLIYSRPVRVWLQGAALARTPARFHIWVTRQLNAIDDGLAWAREFSNYLPVVSLTGLLWFCMLCCVLLTLKGAGIAQAFAACVPVLVFALLGMSVPSGPGYVGTLQVAFVGALHAFSVPAAEAIAASVFYQVMLCVPIVVVCALIVATRGASTTFRSVLINEPKAGDRPDP
jgi:hypothetical protein